MENGPVTRIPYEPQEQDVSRLTIDDVLTLTQEAREAIAEAQEAKAEADGVIAQVENALPTIVDPNRSRLAAVIWGLYWNDDWLRVKAIRAMAEANFGDDLETWRKLIAAQATEECADCGKQVTKNVHSRTEYAAMLRKKGWDRFLCNNCAEIKRQELRVALPKTTNVDEQRSSRLEELREMPYAEYLETPEWKETRRRALQRAAYHCQLCNANGELHVHHKTYERRGHESAADLIVLCKDCHAKHHGIEEPI